MKTIVSDFVDDYKAFSVRTSNGRAYKRPNYGRAVDIGRDSSTVLTTKEAQALFGDSHALRVVNPDNWPGHVWLLQSDIHMVTLSFTFNEIIKMGARLSQKHYGKKLSDIRDPEGDSLSQLFTAAAREHNLQPLNQYFVTSKSLLETFCPGELPETEEGMGDLTLETPNETVATFSDAGGILRDMQVMLCFNEIDFPGYASGNRYYVSGLFAGPKKEAKLPVTQQNELPLAKVMQELHRVL